MALVMLLTIGLTSCSDGNSADTTAASTDAANTADGTSEDTADGTSAETEATVNVDSSLKVNVVTLSGTTGFGMAKLMNDASEGKAALNYSIKVESDAANVTAALLNGSVDIAALPTNAAANLYNKKKDSVQIMAVNTLGVLYVMTAEGVTVESFKDLKGKTVYCPAQNPTFIFNYLCKANDVTVGEDITVDNTYAAPKDLLGAFTTGQVDIAVLPEPMVTVAKYMNASLKVALDLTAEWDKVAEPGSLAQGCIVVRKAFADAHPAEVAAFLAEYEASINFVKENPTEAGTMIQAQGIADNAKVAASAIPNCNLCFIKGGEMKPLLDVYYNAINAIAPSITAPDEGFYYIVK